MVETEFREESLHIAQLLKVHAASRGVSLAQFATAWVLANPVVSSVIAGPRTLAQWQDYLPSLHYQVTAEDEALVDSFVKPGHPSTPGYTDPAYPLMGRVRLAT
jgi:aryl-alcohol dehydrogenase-like predicted oxidoreductase